MCRLSWNVRASSSWNPEGLSKFVQGLLYLYLSGTRQWNGPWSLRSHTFHSIADYAVIIPALRLLAEYTFLYIVIKWPKIWRELQQFTFRVTCGRVLAVCKSDRWQGTIVQNAYVNWKWEMLARSYELCGFWGFYRGGSEVSGLVGCASRSNWFTTFRRNIQPSWKHIS